MGIMWFIAAILFIAASIILLTQNNMWWMIALPALVISQIVIVSSWQDANWGTVINGLILVAIIAAYGNWRFEGAYKKDVLHSLQQQRTVKNDLLTEEDIAALPLQVQHYIRYTGVLNKPRVKNMRIVFEGEMREKGKAWFPFTTVQYNFFDEPTRLFFMKATMLGVTVPGYHAYKNAVATMQVKLFGLIPVVDKSGNELNKAETVTLFNDLCIFAPAALIDRRIKWEPVDSSSVKAIFSNHGITVSAILYFNPAGQLINFVSDDRYEISAKQQYRFSTPVSDYKTINGLNLSSYGEAVWHYPDGAFTYGKFHLKNIEYNCSQLW
jgi:membrane protein implicated in regulation of membrane protease activity